jgi:hypothetical protein
MNLTFTISWLSNEGAQFENVLWRRPANYVATRLNS